MSSRGEESAVSRNPVFKSIGAGQRREILSTLFSRETPVTERELATQLTATDGRSRAADSTTAEDRTARTELIHVHLPVLEDAGLITFDRDAGTIDTTDHPALEDPRFRLLLDIETDGLDEALSSLASEQRRVVLTVLRDAQTSLTGTDLAREHLRSDETDIEPDPEAVDDVVVSLSHVHLPSLDDAGLVDYDRETGRVSYADHPALEDVFTVIYDPDERLVDTYGGFLEGLEAAYRKLGQETRSEADWPHFWRTTHHG